MFRIPRNQEVSLDLSTAQKIVDLFDDCQSALFGRFFIGERDLPLPVFDPAGLTSDPMLKKIFGSFSAKEYATNHALTYAAIEVRTQHGGVALRLYEDTRAFVFDYKPYPFLPTAYLLTTKDPRRMVFETRNMDFEDYINVRHAQRRGILPQQVAHYTRIVHDAFSLMPIRQAYHFLWNHPKQATP